jgi:excisionase family DNA binding protein
MRILLQQDLQQSKGGVVLMNSNGKRLISVEEAATYLGISPRTIYNQCHRKATKRFAVRPRRIGRRVLFAVKDLEVYVDSLGEQ